MQSAFSEARRRLGGANGLGTVLLVLIVLYFAREVLVPLALAGLLAFLLTPLARTLERWGLRRTPAGLLVILLSLGGMGVMGWTVLGQVYNLAVELPQYQQNVTDKIDALHLDSARKLSSTVQMLTSVSRHLSGEGEPSAPTVPVALEPHARRRAAQSTTNVPVLPAAPIAVKVEEPEQSVLTIIGRTVAPLVHPLTTTFIVVIFLVFMLLGREDLRDRGVKLAGSARMHLTTTTIEDASERVSRYLQMQLVVNLCYGVLVALFLWLIGVPHPLLWAVSTCLLRFVPYVGILIAAVGPLLLSVAVTPHWTELIWTVAMFVAMEVVTSNFVEPMLYGASTGVSAMAILIAAIFWTTMWGLPGLFLSTPLTVCLIVIGRQVPQLRYLEVLFGHDAEVLPAERFYQRLLVSNQHEARTLLDDLVRTMSLQEAYDTALIPALTRIEAARHAEEITGSRADELLQSVEEIAEEVGRASNVDTSEVRMLAMRVACVPARDFADEVSCELALQVLSNTASTKGMSADCSTHDLLNALEQDGAELICVIGVPPHTLRHVRMRCHQIRERLPDAVIVACVLSTEVELANLRSSIPMEDAQHVVCSLHQMKEYVSSVLQPALLSPDPHPSGEVGAGGGELKQILREIVPADLLDEPEEEIFNKLVTRLASSFDAPIALITVRDGQRRFWEAQCGLPEGTSARDLLERDLSVCTLIMSSDQTVVVSDVTEDERCANDNLFRSRGIRFYAGTPLKTHDGQIIGCLCVLDTRVRSATEQQTTALTSIANLIMTAIDLQDAGASEEGTSAEPVSANGVTSHLSSDAKITL